MLAILHMSQMWFRRLRDRGFTFPKTYIVFDCETSGLNVQRDYILQLGHLTVENCVPQEPYESILDWTRCPVVPQGTFRQRIMETEQALKARNHAYKFSYHRVANEGIDPLAVLDIYHTLFQQHQDAGCYFLTHNGFRFDTHMVENHFKRFLNSNFSFDRTRVIDTGLLEKAVQLNMMLRDGESIPAFYHRIDQRIAKGVMWSLDKHCIPKYKLAEKYRLDMRNAHHAGFDCHATHLLLEEYRDQAERCPEM